MPTYELTLIMKKMARPRLVEALKRAGQQIYTNGGYIRKVESLGDRRLPNRKTAGDGTKVTEGTYFSFECDLKTNSAPRIMDEFNRDKEIIQKYLLACSDEKVACPQTYDSELLPPSERPSVQQLISEGRRRHPHKKTFSDKTGLDLYPFHR